MTSSTLNHHLQREHLEMIDKCLLLRLKLYLVCVLASYRFGVRMVDHIIQHMVMIAIFNYVKKYYGAWCKFHYKQCMIYCVILTHNTCNTST